jgi:uncharacterized delta-60 repeat protein
MHYPRQAWSVLTLIGLSLGWPLYSQTADSFNPSPNNVVYSLAVQPDGKVLLGGFFTGFIGGPLRQHVGRANSDGLVDTAFIPDADALVNALAIQPDGAIVVAGNFGSLGGQSRQRLGRLSADGTVDLSFNPGADSVVECLALQADGKILVGGRFTNIVGQARSHIARLNPDGTLDATFNPGANDEVYSLAVQTDGAILVGGYFTSLAGQPRNYIGRLNSNGSIDPTFDPGAGGQVSSLAIQADGKVLVGGWFNTLAGTNRSGVGRLNNTAVATNSLDHHGSKVTWLRGGTSPEIWRATFDVSTDGSTWTALGEGTRIAGGWQLNGVSAPGGATYRARGFIQGAQYSGSSWFVETNIGPLAISRQPLGRTNIAGTLAAFSVLAGGGSTPAYQWRQDGTNLTDGLNVTGATTATLVLSNAFLPDAGDYTVVMSDGLTTLTSQVARLTVLDPFISVAVSREAREIARGYPGQLFADRRGSPA